MENLLDSEDVRYMVGALKTLGLDVQEDRVANKAIVVGCSGRFPAGSKAQAVELFLGNAGTAMRPLTAVVAAAGGLARSSSFSCILFLFKLLNLVSTYHVRTFVDNACDTNVTPPFAPSQVFSLLLVMLKNIGKQEGKLATFAHFLCVCHPTI